MKSAFNSCLPPRESLAMEVAVFAPYALGVWDLFSQTCPYFLMQGVAFILHYNRPGVLFLYVQLRFS